MTGKDIVLFTIGQIGVDGALYKAMEFAGSAIRGLSMDSRFTICNMAIEAGAKSGIIAPDEITKAYVKGRYRGTPRYYTSDPDCLYEKIYRWKADEIPLMVAKPHLPSNTQPAAELNGIAIDQVVIGSCTNGRIEDLRMAADVLRGRKVHKDVRLIVIPATQAIWQQANDEGLFDVFIEAEAAVSAPTCGPCLGGHMGVLAAGERAVSTTNRNFVGRMGDVRAPRCTWPARTWPPPARWRDTSPRRNRSAPAGCRSPLAEGGRHERRPARQGLDFRARRRHRPHHPGALPQHEDRRGAGAVLHVRRRSRSSPRRSTRATSWWPRRTSGAVPAASMLPSR